MKYVVVLGLAVGLMGQSAAIAQSVTGTVDAGVVPSQQINNGASSGVNSAIDSNINNTNRNTNNNNSGAVNYNDINTSSTLDNSISNDSRLINDSKIIQDSRTVYDGRVINDNRQITIGNPDNTQQKPVVPTQTDDPFLTQFPNIYPAQPSEYGLGPGISCPGPTMSVNTYTRQGAGYRSENGGTVSVTFPLGSPSAVTCELAGQKYIQVLESQRQLYQSQADMYRVQIEKLNAEVQQLRLQNAANARKLQNARGGGGQPTARSQ